MKEIIRAETVNFETFTARLRSFTAHCIERSEALKVPLYPDARDLLAASDDDFKVVQLRNAYTHQQLDALIESWEDRLYRYLAQAYIGRIATAGQPDTHQLLTRPVDTDRTRHDGAQ